MVPHRRLGYPRDFALERVLMHQRRLFQRNFNIILVDGLDPGVGRGCRKAELLFRLFGSGLI